MYKVYSGLFWHYFFRCFLSTKLCLRFLLICFSFGMKRFYRSSLVNELGFRDVSLNILDKNQSFKKLRHGFIEERALITTALISSCHRKTLAPFSLQKKRLENAFLTLIVNYRKIVQKNKLLSKRTINCLFIYDVIY